MHSRHRLILTTLAAAAIMACCIGTASANRLSISNKNVRSVFNELVLTNGAGGEGLVTCPVTLEGSFHETIIRKVEGSLIGYVSRASVASASCRGGSATLSQESLPWHITYQGFAGRLPNITEQTLSLRNVNFRVTVLGVNCGYGRPGESARFIARIASGVFTALIPESNIALQKLSGGAFCPGTGGFSGTGTVTLLGTTTRISVRLI
jgi:hypothetical protein